MNQQTAMFTSEQMKGTGQLNMLDQIQEEEDRAREEEEENTFDRVNTNNVVYQTKI